MPGVARLCAHGDGHSHFTSLGAERRVGVAGLDVTTPERTAFDIGRRGKLGRAVASLDSLAAATRIAADDVIQLALEHPGARGLPQLRAALELVDAGAESPKETWLRLLLIGANYPRPRTQIPVLSPDGHRWYYLDMGWEDRMLAVEYDGDHHRSDPIQFAYDIRRLADIDERGWRLVRVAPRSRQDDVLRRVQRAWMRAPLCADGGRYWNSRTVSTESG